MYDWPVQPLVAATLNALCFMFSHQQCKTSKTNIVCYFFIQAPVDTSSYFIPNFHFPNGTAVVEKRGSNALVVREVTIDEKTSQSLVVRMSICGAKN